MQLFGLKNCDTCRKAMKVLPGAQLVDVRTDGVPAQVLAQAEAAFGEALVNRRSTTWRGLDETKKILPVRDLLAQEPTVMKRPLIVDGDRMTLGWTKDTMTQWGVS